MSCEAHRKMRISLCLLASISLLSLVMYASAFTAGNFDVTIVSQSHSLTHHEVIISVKNLQPTNKPFDLRFLINGTNFNIGKVHDLFIHEWKVLPTEVTTYSKTLIPKQCWEISNVTSANETWDCSYWDDIPTTQILNVVQWKPSKMALITQGSSVSAGYGQINIPKAGSKCSYDDLNASYDCDGEKIFRISWDTPITRSSSGWGSSGYFTVYDSLTGLSYDPWWNASYSAMDTLLWNNSDSKNHENEIAYVWLNTTGSHAIAECEEMVLVNHTTQEQLNWSIIYNQAPDCLVQLLINSTAGVLNEPMADFYYDYTQNTTHGTNMYMYDGFDGTGLTGFWETKTGASVAGGICTIADSTGNLISYKNTTWKLPYTFHAKVTFTTGTQHGGIGTITTPISGNWNSTRLSGEGTPPNTWLAILTRNGAQSQPAVGGIQSKNSFDVLINANSTAAHYKVYNDTWGLETEITDKPWNSGWAGVAIYLSASGVSGYQVDYTELLDIGNANYYAVPGTGKFEGEETQSTVPLTWHTNETTGNLAYGIASVHNYSVMWSSSSAQGYNYSFISTNVTGTWANLSTQRVGNASYALFIPPAGPHCWQFYANDTANAWNNTQIVCKSIAKDAGSVSLTLSATGNFTYGTAETATCYNQRTDGGATTKLWRNATDITAAENGTAVYLGVGIYNYTCNVTATQNFTSNYSTSLINITKATPSLVISMLPSATISYPTKSNVTGENCPSQLSCKLYRNGTEASNPDNDFYDVGTLIYIYNTSGNANYSAASVTKTLTITAEEVVTGGGSTFEEGIMIGAAAGAFLFLWMAAGFNDKKWRAMQALFMFIGIFLIANMFALANSIAVENEASTETQNMLGTLVTVSAYAIWISLAYFIIMVAVTALQYLMGRKAKTDV